MPLLREHAPEATRAQLCLAHPEAHVDRMLGMHPAEGEVISIDPDTIVSPGTMQAALRAAGGAVAAVDAVMQGWASAAFVAARPPGHHAEADPRDGLLLLQQRRGRRAPRAGALGPGPGRGGGFRRPPWQTVQRTSLPPIRPCSMDRVTSTPASPGTGSPRDRGVSDNIVNVQLAPGSGSDRFRAAWADRIIPALDAWGPELLVISAGFDAHRADPLAELRVETEDFAWLTDQLLAVADARCGGRVVSVLEGGYDLRALAASSAAHVRRLMRA